nr:unnamed protein product [Digitaria exilis]
MVKFVWGIVATVVGAPCRPNSFDQYWLWHTPPDDAALILLH